MLGEVVMRSGEHSQSRMVLMMCGSSMLSRVVDRQAEEEEGDEEGEDDDELEDDGIAEENGRQDTVASACNDWNGRGHDEEVTEAETEAETEDEGEDRGWAEGEETKDTDEADEREVRKDSEGEVMEVDESYAHGELEDARVAIAQERGPVPRANWTGVDRVRDELIDTVS